MPKSTSLLKIVLIITLLALGLSMPRTSRAAILTVTDFGDSDCANPVPGQLRTLINQAAPGDTINIPAGTITLNGLSGDQGNCSGDLDIVNNLTIVGAGTGQTIIQAGTTPNNGVDRIFDMFGPASITLNGLTLRHGRNNTTGLGEGGGAIRARGVDLTIVNSVLTLNAAVRFTGGAIVHIFGGTLTIDNTTVSNNTGNVAGGILGGGNALIIQNNSLITGNVTNGGSGGGLFVDNGTALTITDSTISSNIAFGIPYSPDWLGGGGIEAYGPITITNSVIQNNKVISPDATNHVHGGGLTAGGPSTVITNSRIIDNELNSANGFVQGGGISGGNVTITDSFIMNNRAIGGQRALGGGLSGGGFTLNNTLVMGNWVAGKTDTGGGGIEANGPVQIVNSSLLWNKATVTNSADLTEDGGGGGAIYVSQASVTIQGSTIANNEATVVDYGGGGGLNLSGGTATITNTSFFGNKVTGGAGQAIYTRWDGAVTLTHVTIDQQQTVQSGIHSTSSTPVIISRSILNGSPGLCDGPNTNFVSGGYNVVSNSSCPSFTGPGDVLNADPKLAPAGTYGGPTMTLGLQSGSAALNRIPAGECTVATDQRGVARPQPGGGACDSGAVEGLVRTIDTVGIYRPTATRFFFRNSNTTGPADFSTPITGSILDWPLVGDWNGDGVDTVGLYRPSTGQFFLKDSNQVSAPTIYTFSFGPQNSVPMAGDWNGDGRDSIGVYVPQSGQFWLRNTLTAGPADFVTTFGSASDRPVIGDWDGDGVESIGLYRTANARFYLTNQVCSCVPMVNYQFTLGNPGDFGFAGDWNGDGRSGAGVFRPTNGLIFLRNALSTGFADVQIVFGIANDIPLAGRWLPSENIPAPGPDSAPPFGASAAR